MRSNTTFYQVAIIDHDCNLFNWHTFFLGPHLRTADIGNTDTLIRLRRVPKPGKPDVVPPL